MTRVCIFGDSHLACGKAALNAGLVDTDGIDFEFWGADGPLFRQLQMEDGEIRATPDAAERIELVNGRGRKSLAPDDFDLMLFLGARLRTFEFFAPNLHLMRQSGIFASEAVARRAVEKWMESTRAYRFARSFAQASPCRIAFAPVPFPTEGVLPNQMSGVELAETATAADRDRIWALIEDKVTRDGVTMLRQPPETITKGCLTDSAYGVARAKETRDAVHKNAQYGALVVADALALLVEPDAKVASRSGAKQ